VIFARWTANRKKEVLRQIDDGIISEAEATSLHGLSAEELAAWRVGYVFATKTPKAIRRTKPRPRKSHAIPALVPPQEAEAADG
jgi:hypothetical protein